MNAENIAIARSDNQRLDIEDTYRMFERPVKTAKARQRGLSHDAF